MDDDGSQPIAIVHLSDPDDLEKGKADQCNVGKLEDKRMYSILIKNISLTYRM